MGAPPGTAVRKNLLVERNWERAHPFAEVPIDASQVIWVATANDGRSIPDPILNRMNVYEVQAPDTLTTVAQALANVINSSNSGAGDPNVTALANTTSD